MRLLLDTQVWLWMQASPGRLGEAGLSTLRDPANELFLSAASAWEIAIKYALGRLPLPEAPESYVPDRMRRSGTSGLAVEHAHALKVADLPSHHRDPFDRMLIAQSKVEGMAVLTSDPAFESYDIELIQL